MGGGNTNNHSEKKEDTTVVMQIDNPEMGNSREVVTLEVPPRLVGERTMVRAGEQYRKRLKRR